MEQKKKDSLKLLQRVEKNLAFMSSIFQHYYHDLMKKLLFNCRPVCTGEETWRRWLQRDPRWAWESVQQEEWTWWDERPHLGWHVWNGAQASRWNCWQEEHSGTHPARDQTFAWEGSGMVLFIFLLPRLFSCWLPLRWTGHVQPLSNVYCANFPLPELCVFSILFPNYLVVFGLLYNTLFCVILLGARCAL